jgi:lactoylglutathione lyase
MENFDIKQYLNVDQDKACKDYIMQQTMIRVKDPKVSLDFYIKALGFNLVWWAEYPQWGFSLYFVAYCKKTDIPEDMQERQAFAFKTPGCVEITWNHGSEKAEGKVYNTGNGDATGTKDGEPIKGGFGHIGITVDNVYDCCERLHKMGFPLHKSPNSGGMKGLAFVKDPDGYLIEILPQGPFLI